MVVALLSALSVGCAASETAKLENEVSALRQRLQHMEQRIKRLEGGGRGTKAKAGRAKMSKNKAVGLQGGGTQSGKVKATKNKTRSKAKRKAKAGGAAAEGQDPSAE